MVKEIEKESERVRGLLRTVSSTIVAPPDREPLYTRTASKEEKSVKENEWKST